MFIRPQARIVRWSLPMAALLVAGALTAAHADDPSGIYGLDAGKLAIKVQSPSLVKGVASLPNLKTLADRTGLKGQVSFGPTSGQSENFSLILPSLPLVGTLSVPGTWSTAGTGKFSVVLVKDADVQQVVALINQLAGRSDITARVTKNTFTGKVLSGNQVKATFALGLVVTVPPVTLTIALSGAIGGAYVGPIPTTPAPATRDFLTGFVVDEVRDLTVR